MKTKHHPILSAPVTQSGDKNAKQRTDYMKTTSYWPAIFSIAGKGCVLFAALCAPLPPVTVAGSSPDANDEGCPVEVRDCPFEPPFVLMCPPIVTIPGGQTKGTTTIYWRGGEKHPHVALYFSLNGGPQKIFPPSILDFPKGCKFRVGRGESYRFVLREVSDAGGGNHSRRSANAAAVVVTEVDGKKYYAGKELASRTVTCESESFFKPGSLPKSSGKIEDYVSGQTVPNGVQVPKPTPKPATTPVSGSGTAGGFIQMHTPAPSPSKPAPSAEADESSSNDTEDDQHGKHKKNKRKHHHHHDDDNQDQGND